MGAAIKILERPAEVVWDYDEEADVLYLSVGEPRSAVGVDIGEGSSRATTRKTKN